MLMVASMGGIVVLLLFYGEVHIRNFLVPSEVGDVSGGLACTRIAVVGSVKTTRGAIPPVIVTFNWMGWVVALSRGDGIVASAAATSIVVVAAVAPTVKLWIVVLLRQGCVVGLGGGQVRWWGWHVHGCR
jgi:hypothetical protein